MPNFKDLTVPRISLPGGVVDPKDVANVLNQLVKFSQSVCTILNGLILNGQIQRVDQDAYALGGTGAPLSVADGGTGRSTLTAHSVLVGEGTIAVGMVGPGAAFTILQGEGASADPAFTAFPTVSGLTVGDITTNAGQVRLYDPIDDVYVLLDVNASLLVVSLNTGGANIGLQVGTHFVYDNSLSALSLLGTSVSASSIVLYEKTTNGSNSATIFAPTSIASNFNFNLPATAGTSGQLLTSAGGGSSAMTWTSASALAVALTVGSTVINSGTTTRILYDNAGVLGEYTLTGTGTVVAMQTAPKLLGASCGSQGVAPSSGTRLRVDQTENSGANSAAVMEFGNGSQTFFMFLDTSASGGKFQIRTDSSRAVILQDVATTSGNCGVGNASPGEKLDVTGNITASGHVNAAAKAYITAAYNGSTGVTGGSRPALYLSDGTTNGTFQVVSGVFFGAVSNHSVNVLTNNTTRVTFNNGDVTLANAIDIAVGTSTGTKIGTATSQKLSLWNATPIVQPTTAVAGATRTGGGGTTLTDTDTFDGYTVAQIVKALRNIGALA